MNIIQHHPHRAAGAGLVRAPGAVHDDDECIFWRFQREKSGDPRVQIFTQNITGELFAQETRQGGQGTNGGIAGASPMAQAIGGGNRTITEIMPDKVQGGEQQQQANPAI